MLPTPAMPTPASAGRRALTGGATECERAAVAPVSRPGYAYFLKQFLDWASAGRRTLSEKSIELTLLDYFDVMMSLGRSASDAEKTFAAVVDHLPNLANHRLARARRALRGYRKRVPPRSRYPLAEELVAAVAGALLYEGHWAMALLVLLSCYCYLRPGEARQLKRGHVIAPSRVGARRPRAVGLLLAPQDEGTPSKTGIFDETVLVDFPECLGPALQRFLRDGARAELPLFGLSDAETLQLWRQALRLVDLPPTLVLYQLRHSGPSADLLARRRSPGEVQSRGRWRSAQSLRRYAKPGQVQRFLNQQSDRTREYGIWCLTNLEGLLTGRVTPRRPPNA